MTHRSATLTDFFPGELWPDDNGVHINAHGGGILLHEGAYYWFGEHKIEGEAGNSAQVGVHVYSSRDLYNWKDNGIALAVEDDPQSDIARGCILERPKVIYNPRTRKFVMWFHLELLGQGYKAARSGVAVADRPTGPYRFIESFRPNAGVWPLNTPPELRQPLNAVEEVELNSVERSGGMYHGFPKDLVFRRDFEVGQMARDMTLFVDDDGTAFHIYASEENGTLQISQLSDDYLRPAGRYVRIFPGRFHEGPAVMKHNGRYFLFSSDCTVWSPNPARLSTAPSIWGPWEELGNPCRGSEPQVATTFESQSTFVLPVAGKPGAFVFMADRWRPKDAIDGRYVWLPIEFRDGVPLLRWHERWDLSFFNAVEA
jgi:beta-xylosidase